MLLAFTTRCIVRSNHLTLHLILWNSIALTSSVFTELANTIKYGGGDLILDCFHRVGIQNGFWWHHRISFTAHFDATVVEGASLESWRSWVRTPALAFKFQKNTFFLPRSLIKIQYCWEPPWPRGSMLGPTLPGFEFRILCLEDSVISFISPSSGGSPGPV